MKSDQRFIGTYLGNSYSQLQNLIGLADTKANIIIALIGVILSLFFNFFVSKSVLPMWQVTSIILLFFISGGFALSTLYPRIPKKTGKFSLTYFKDAIENDIKITSELFINKNVDNIIIEDLIRNIKTLSLIVDKKFTNLRYSYIFFGLAIIVKVIFELFSWF